MDSTWKFLVFAVSAISIFAWKKENDEQPNVYSSCFPEKNDSKARTLSKLENCLKAQERSIKWRRSFLASIIIVVLIFGLLKFRLPESRELILYTMIIYCGFYIMLNISIDIVNTPVEKIGLNLIRKIRLKSFGQFTPLETSSEKFS